VKNIPGSHVIIRKKNRGEDFFPDKTIGEAAVVAAYHSKARDSGQVAVDYTLVRNVKKPVNAKPGMVNYFEYHSAYATPDAELIKNLKAGN
jgi:predicted ribosome quality control (RQC) complex YloA/Tae2 family protein